ncbi:hypothetical protein [Paenibacillus donghaensis]|uniref:Uncharacterized protein n=1 Tax=Paenibacillus donghaensis TaxID=414771 RepID=A0A2Z2KCN7_9BACL|nr:hypothetical protein [Paenibacillus donghaensis]ASA20760.1 hypothetical protein B9T62_08160 [Paenibacillus donghaensis]
MIRMFPQHVKRESMLVDGYWDFAVDAHNRGVQEQSDADISGRLLRKLAGAGRNSPVTNSLNSEIVYTVEEAWPEKQEYLQVHVRQAWRNLRLWEHEDPTLDG